MDRPKGEFLYIAIVKESIRAIVLFHNDLSPSGEQP